MSRQPLNPKAAEQGARAAEPQVEEIYRPDLRWAALVTLAVGVLYTLTLAPTTQFWDTSEYIATGHILGIPHPPGNPLFVLLARSWDVLLSPLGLSVAVRINLFSAFMSAAAHGLWFLVIQRVLATFTARGAVQRVGAAAAVLVSATAFTVWNQSNVNEKVYTVSLFTIALISWLMFRWRDRQGQGRDDNLLVLIAFILALSVGNHLMTFLAAPAVLVFVALVHPAVLGNWRLYVVTLGALALGLSIHLFLPLRAALDPVINEADPTCASVGSALASILTWGQAGCVELSAALSRKQYDKPPLVPRLAPFTYQIANYLQYFDWQWARALDGGNTLFAAARAPFTLLFALLGIAGAREHRRRDPATWAYVAVLFTTLSFGLVAYLNFRYGYSIADPLNNRDLHEVRERDYFFVVGFSVWGLWAGVGITAAWLWLSERVGSLAKGAPVLAIAALPLLLNATWAGRQDDYSARDWAYNLLMSVEPYGVLFTNGDNDTFPLWYLQETEGIRQDVTVIVTSYLNTDWYIKQLRDLTAPCPQADADLVSPTRIVCQRAYRPERDGAAYVFGSAPPPTGFSIPLSAPIRLPTRSIIALDDATIEGIAQTFVPMNEPRGYTIGRIDAVIPAGQVLVPWHQYALAILSTALGERPVYFASSGAAPAAIGLEGHLVRQGLAFRVYEDPLESAPVDIVRMDDTPLRAVLGPWVDIERTRTLMDEVFVHRSGLPDGWDHWPDQSTIGIPNYYAWAWYALAQAAAQAGDNEGLDRYGERGDAWSLLGTPGG